MTLKSDDKSINEVKKKIDKLIKTNKETYSSIFWHIMPFIVINILLFVIYFFTTPFGYPWFLYPLFGWAIGLASHLGIAVVSKKHYTLLKKLPHNISVNQFKYIKRFLENESGIVSHIPTFIAGSIFLIMINFVINSIAFPFSFIAIAGWGIGLVSHLVSYFNIKNKTKEKLKENGFDFDNIKNTDIAVNINIKKDSAINLDKFSKNILEEAEQIINTILSRIKTSENIKNKLDEDIGNVFDKYISQIKKFLKRKSQILETINTISIDDYENKILELQKKIEKTDNKSLKKEYQKSIDQYKRHEESSKKLHDQMELIDIKINQSLMAVKQLHLDITHLDEVVEKDVDTSIETILMRSKQISSYVDNLKTSYEELDREL